MPQARTLRQTSEGEELKPELGGQPSFIRDSAVGATTVSVVSPGRLIECSITTPVIQILQWCEKIFNVNPGFQWGPVDRKGHQTERTIVVRKGCLRSCGHSQAASHCTWRFDLCLSSRQSPARIPVPIEDQRNKKTTERNVRLRFGEICRGLSNAGTWKTSVLEPAQLCQPKEEGRRYGAIRWSYQQGST